MARPINAALTVQAFASTGNPGEYTFDSAAYNNQADATANGAYDVAVGFVLYVPATDVNSYTIVPGVVHRYILTSVTVVDTYTISGTILWDEPGPEQDTPTNSVACILAQVTTVLGLGMLPSDVVYSELAGGSSFQAFSVDERNILDNPSAAPVPNPTSSTQEPLTINMAGDSIAPLLNTPLSPASVVIWVNGIRYWYINDFSITGKNITWTNAAFYPDQFDTVIAEYSY